MNKVASNTAIIGLGSTAKITGGGLNLDEVTNIMIQNITFEGWDDDAINMQDYTTHVWVDHCVFLGGYDGSVDAKRGTDFITVSWNYFTNHNKLALFHNTVVPR